MYRNRSIFLVIFPAVTALCVFTFVCNVTSAHISIKRLITEKYTSTESIKSSTQLNIENTRYAAVIDAGSSGSRIYIYQWPIPSGRRNELLNVTQSFDEKKRPIVLRINPGISSFASDIKKISAYLAPLLDFASNYIPEEKQSLTPLYLFATAGMRLLAKDSQDAILQEVRSFVRTKYKFLFADKHVKVITGKEEGVFAWISTNYLLGRFNHDNLDSAMEDNEQRRVGHWDQKNIEGNIHRRKKTVGILDMGGASMQIAFEVPQSIVLDKSYMAEFNLGCRDSDALHIYRIFVTTFLEFGANAARIRYENFLIERHNSSLFDTPIKSVETNATTMKERQESAKRIYDPCLPLGLNTDVKRSQEVQFRGTGDFRKCVATTRSLLKLDTPCPAKQFFMDGVVRPNINFYNIEFYGFSEFWYSLQDIFELGEHYRRNRLSSISETFCAKDESTLRKELKSSEYRNAKWERTRMQCFKAAWIMSVLHSGLKFPLDYRGLHSIQYIRNTETQWALGAVLFMTRYFPLRHETHNGVDIQSHKYLTSGAPSCKSIMLFLVGTVVLGLLVYLKSSSYRVSLRMARLSLNKCISDSSYNMVRMIRALTSSRSPIPAIIGTTRSDNETTIYFS